MAARAPLALVSLVLTAGACVFLFLVVLAGTRDRSPLDQIYFLRADTSDISGAPEQARWTLWNVCAVTDDRNDCPKPRPAYPFDPRRNFDSEENMPDGFLDTDKYYLMSRFMFAFIIIALFFTVLALLSGLLALVSRLGGALAGLLSGIALFFQACFAALMTALYVLARRRFRDDDKEAQLGLRAFAFVWAAFACLLLSTLFFCAILGTGRDKSSRRSGRGFFGRKRSTRDRGSFVESESQRRVKEEY